MRTLKRYASLIALTAAVSAPVAAFAQSGVNDIVIDKRGYPVTDKRGQCVITKWLVPHNACGQYAEARSYLVFFDFDRFTITPEAARILNTLAQETRGKKLRSVEVVGHADRSGSAKYNVALSKKRSQAVKNALVKIGFPKNLIKTLAKGESEPLVPTNDGVREPQNRRVEILINE